MFLFKFERKEMFSGKWIQCDQMMLAPLVIKRFSVESVTDAIIDICGLGYYELFINGKRVGEEYFKPVFSDYRQRDFSEFLYPLNDQTSHTIYYNTYNIMPYIKQGDNVLAIMLGNGYYRQKRRMAEGDVSFGNALIAKYDITLLCNKKEEHIISDGSEVCIPSYIKENNLFYGEVQDYQTFDFSVLTDATFDFEGVKVDIIDIPNVSLRKQGAPNDRVCRKLIPKLLFTDGNKKIYDVGENVSGNVSFIATGGTVHIRHAENLCGQELDFESAGGDAQVYECVYKNTIPGSSLHPYFSWGGFRYFELEGEVEELEVLVIHSSVEPRATFHSGNEMLNWLFDTFIKTQLYNMHSGIPTDCPHRERLGYTGDGQLTAECAMLTLNAKEFYKKWIQDIADCQDIKTGHVQHTAPFCGGGGGPGGWGGAMVLVPYAYYKIYGDIGIIETYLPNMKAYLECMRGFCENGLVVKEREKGWCLGEWCAPTPIEISEPFINTYFYIICMQKTMEVAKLLGQDLDYSKQIEQCKSALRQAYYDENNNHYCNGKQGADVFACLMGLGNEEMQEAIINHYKQTGVFDVGIFGMDALSDFLIQTGNVQLLYQLLTVEKYPSFWNMRKNGATTFWESWNGGSHNHPMYGSFIKQLFYGFLGIKFDAGFKNISIAPTYIDGLNFVEGSLELEDGRRLYVRHDFVDGQIKSIIK